MSSERVRSSPRVAAIVPSRLIEFKRLNGSSLLSSSLSTREDDGQDNESKNKRCTHIKIAIGINASSAMSIDRCYPLNAL